MSSKSREEADYLAERLSDAICGWLTFQQAARRSRAYNEHLTYLPIFEVADGRGWRVYPQFALRDEASRAGAPNTVDFLFLHKRHRAFVALEIKFQKSPRAPTQAFTPDVAKLLRVRHETILAELPRLNKYCSSSYPIYRYLMTIGQSDGLRWLWSKRRENEKLREQAVRLWEKAHPEDEIMPAKTKDGIVCISMADVERDFRIVTLFQRIWWSASNQQKTKAKKTKAKART